MTYVFELVAERGHLDFTEVDFAKVRFHLSELVPDTKVTLVGDPPSRIRVVALGERAEVAPDLLLRVEQLAGTTLRVEFSKEDEQLTKRRGRPDIAVLVLSATGALVLLACGPIVGWLPIAGLGGIYLMAGTLAFIRPIAFPPNGFGETARWEAPLLLLGLVLFGLSRKLDAAGVVLACFIAAFTGWWTVSTLRHAARLRSVGTWPLERH